MLIKEILLEYRRDITAKRFGVQLKKLFPNMEPENILAGIEQIDPTHNKIYVPWIVLHLTREGLDLKDHQEIKQNLESYHNIKHKLPLDQRDINRLSYPALKKIIHRTFHDVSLNDNTSHDDEDVEVLYDGPLGKLLIPKTEEASCRIGSSAWCTAYTTSENLFNAYNKDGNLYVWIDKNGKKYQFHFEREEFYDGTNTPMKRDEVVHFMNHPVISKLFKRYYGK